MKPGIRLATLLALLAGGCRLAPAGPPADARPMLRILPAGRDLGRVAAPGPVETTFTLRNVGSAELRVRAVTEDCGCIHTSYPPALAPGAEGALKLRFEPPPLWSGPVERRVRVESNDPASPRSEISLKAVIEPLLKVGPGGPLTLDFEPDAVYRRELTLSTREPGKLRVVGASADLPFVRPLLLPEDAGGARRLAVTVGPVRRPGDFSGAILLRTTDERLPVARVAVTLRARRGPVLTQGRVHLASLREVRDGQVLERVGVFTRKGTLRVLSAGSPSPRLRVRPRPGQGGLTELELAARGQWPSGTLETTVRIRTDDRRFPDILLPFTATVQ